VSITALAGWASVGGLSHGGGGISRSKPPIPAFQVWFCSEREEERAFWVDQDGGKKSVTRVEVCPGIPVNKGEGVLAEKEYADGYYIGEVSYEGFRPIAGPVPHLGDVSPHRQAGPLDGNISPDGRYMVAALEVAADALDPTEYPRYLDGIGPFEPGSLLDLFLIDLHSGDLIRLTDDPYRDYEPRFLPDGSGIIWGSQRDGPGDAYYLDLETRQVERLTTGTLPARDFSVQGHLLAFHRGWGDGEESGDQELYLFDLETRQERRLTWNDWNDTGPELSHDGSMICWTAKRGGHWEADIMAMELSSGRPWPVTEVPGRVDYCQWHPSAPVVIAVVYGTENREIYRSGWGAKGPLVNLSNWVGEDHTPVVMGVSQ